MMVLMGMLVATGMMMILVMISSSFNVNHSSFVLLYSILYIMEAIDRESVYLLIPFITFRFVHF